MGAKPMTAADDRAAQPSPTSLRIGAFEVFQRADEISLRDHSDPRRRTLFFPVNSMEDRFLAVLLANGSALSLPDAAQARREAMDFCARRCRDASETAQTEAEAADALADIHVEFRALAAQPAARGIDLMRGWTDRGEKEHEQGHRKLASAGPAGDCLGNTQPAGSATPPLDDASVLERAADLWERENPTTEADGVHPVVRLLRESAASFRQPPAPKPAPDVFRKFEDEFEANSHDIEGRAREWFGPLVKALVRIYNDGASRYDAQIALDALAQLRARAKEASRG